MKLPPYVTSNAIFFTCKMLLEIPAPSSDRIKSLFISLMFAASSVSDSSLILPSGFLEVQDGREKRRWLEL